VEWLHKSTYLKDSYAMVSILRRDKSYQIFMTLPRATAKALTAFPPRAIIMHFILCMYCIMLIMKMLTWRCHVIDINVLYQSISLF
jgi:hypothetical protein